MQRRNFIQQASLATLGVLASTQNFGQYNTNFPVVRVPINKRNFVSQAVEDTIETVQKNIGNKEIAWLFGNCFPNTLDTTVEFEIINGKPDTYVITGDIDAMWLRDSTAQVWPYLTLVHKDKKLQQLVAGVINRQSKCIIKDPYANAFFKDQNKVSDWKDDLTEMKPGIHERKWEIDSLCYPIRLSYHYYKQTKDASVFDDQWKAAAQLIIKTFKEQQRKTDKGSYHFQRKTAWASDGVVLNGYGYPVKPNGLICSIFRPSDDATIYPYLIPSNFFAAVSLQQLGYIFSFIYKDNVLAQEASNLQKEITAALLQNATTIHPIFGKVYAYEINGYGSFNLMDDANVPSLLSLPYLGAVSTTDPTYQNTRRLLLSSYNPFYFKGKVAEGIGGPHAGINMIWPLSIITRGLTSNNNQEIKQCINMLQKTHANTGFIHEAFNKDNASDFTRKWFAWANTIFGEFILKTYQNQKQLLD